MTMLLKRVGWGMIFWGWWGGMVWGLTIVPSHQDVGELSLTLGRSSSDNSTATSFDPLNTTFLWGQYGLSDRFSLAAVAGFSEYQNVPSSTTVKGTPSLFGVGFRYLLTEHTLAKDQVRKSPIDVALNLGYQVSTANFETGGVTTGTSAGNLIYGIVLSHTFEFDHWPFKFIPYGAFQLNSITTTTSALGTSATINETLKSLDVGIRFPLYRELWLFGEYNYVTGYTDASGLKDSTTNVWTFGGGIRFDFARMRSRS